MNVIIDKITEDMEFAVKNVPDRAEYIGMVTKAACRQLLIKCYLAQGEFDKAISQADTLIDHSGFELMKSNFGTFVNPMPAVHKVTRNVIWDLHRPENKAIAANKEVLHVMINREESADSRNRMRTMRVLVPFWAGTGSIGIKTPDGKDGMNISTTYYDYRKTYGRGIGRLRLTNYSQYSGWNNDPGDLRHNSAVGNWMVMDSLKYNSPALFSEGNQYAGKNIFSDDGRLLCSDSIRNWYNWPHYKIWLEDPRKEGASEYEGGGADWYVYRLAETYLLRAEAYIWKGSSYYAKAAADINEVRKRAQCTNLYTAADMNIGVVMDERMRELYYEEFRHDELSRASYIFALTGQADEFGNTYTRETLADKNYWYTRVDKYNNFYNKGVTNRSGVTYTISPYHMFYPVPQISIDANRESRINQNKGYVGYEHNIAPYDNLADALAGED